MRPTWKLVVFLVVSGVIALAVGRRDRSARMWEAFGVALTTLLVLRAELTGTLKKKSLM